MSTKIYTGFVLDDMSIAELHQHITEFRNELKPLIKAEVLDYYVRECQVLVDMSTINKDFEYRDGIYSRVFKMFEEQEAKVRQTGKKDPMVDFEFSMVFYPHNGKIYGTYYTVQQSFATLWQTKPFVHDFMYYNNSDKPEDISIEEWNERGQIWDDIFGEAGIPSQVGFIYECGRSYVLEHPEPAEIISNFSSVLERSQNLAKEEMYNEYMSNRKVTQENVMKIMRGFYESLDTPEGKMKLEAKADDISKKLKLNVTEADLILTVS